MYLLGSTKWASNNKINFTFTQFYLYVVMGDASKWRVDKCHFNVDLWDWGRLIFYYWTVSGIIISVDEHLRYFNQSCATNFIFSLVINIFAWKLSILPVHALSVSILNVNTILSKFVFSKRQPFSFKHLYKNDDFGFTLFNVFTCQMVE